MREAERRTSKKSNSHNDTKEPTFPCTQVILGRANIKRAMVWTKVQKRYWSCSLFPRLYVSLDMLPPPSLCTHFLVPGIYSRSKIRCLIRKSRWLWSEQRCQAAVTCQKWRLLRFLPSRECHPRWCGSFHRPTRNTNERCKAHENKG